MNGGLPVRSLMRLNLTLTLIVSVTDFLFLLISQPLTKSLIFLIMSLVLVSLIGQFNIYVLIFFHKHFHSKSRKIRWFRFLVAYLGSIVIYSIIWVIFKAIFGHPDTNFLNERNISIILISAAMINALIIVVQDYVLLISAKGKADLEFARLKSVHAEAANLLLKQQIHPHFLFNALNTIKILYHKDIPSGDSYLVHLANFLRASISNHSARMSNLGEELSIVNDYVAMQQIRFGSAFSCTIKVDTESLKKKYLPSFSLQPLVENAIKHNDVTEEHALIITIQQDNDSIVVINNLQRKSMVEQSTGNGLANLAERYKLVSGDDIEIKQEGGIFSVRIKLLANEHRDYRG
ncbi:MULTISPECIES: sensor histidine kinase [Chitinophagaceae]